MEGRRKRVQYKLRLYCDEGAECDFQEKIVEAAELARCACGRALQKRIQRSQGLRIETDKLLGPCAANRPLQLAADVPVIADRSRAHSKRAVKRPASPLPQVMLSSDSSSSLDCSAIELDSTPASTPHITPRSPSLSHAISLSSDEIQVPARSQSICEISDSEPCENGWYQSSDRLRILGEARSQALTNAERAKIFEEYAGAEVYDCGGAGDCGPFCISAFLQLMQLKHHSCNVVRNCVAQQCNCNCNCAKGQVWWSNLCLAACARVYNLHLIVIERIASDAGTSGNNHNVITSFWPDGEPNGMQITPHTLCLLLQRDCLLC